MSLREEIKEILEDRMTVGIWDHPTIVAIRELVYKENTDE